VRKHKDRVVFHFTVRQTLIDGRQLGTEDAGLGRQQLVPRGVLAIHRPRPPGTRDPLDPRLLATGETRLLFASQRGAFPSVWDGSPFKEFWYASFHISL